MTTRNGYDVVHGPAVYSDMFSATAGDAIYFDWRALAGGDAYDVFGYLLNTTKGAATDVLECHRHEHQRHDELGHRKREHSDQRHYRFVFVSGTYDFSGGQGGGRILVHRQRSCFWFAG